MFKALRAVPGTRALGFAMALAALPFGLAHAVAPGPVPPPKPAVAPVAAKKPAPATTPISKPAAPTGVKAPARPAAPAPAKPPAPAQPPKINCATEGSTVVLLPSDNDIRCNEVFEECKGAIKLAAKNCTGEFQSFHKIELYEPGDNGRRIQELEFSPATIAGPNGLWKEEIPWTTPAELVAVVYYRPPGQTDERSVRGPVSINNKVMVAAKQACEKCQGTWGRYGTNKYEQCNCKTTDSGKECHDGDECQGHCIFQRYDDEGREEGSCSETVRLTGCVPIVEKGQSKYPPPAVKLRKRPVCFD